jgi:hypothetical protein
VIRQTIYGLICSGRLQYDTLVSALEGIGFRKTRADPLYIHIQGEWKYPRLVDCRKWNLRTTFGQCSWSFPSITHDYEEFIAMEIDYDLQRGILVAKHKKYIVVHKAGLEGTLHKLTPGVVGSRLHDNNDIAISATETAGPPSPPLDDLEVSNYRSIVGTLLYTSVTLRPGISYQVNELARHMQQPTRAARKAANRVVLHLEGTSQLGLRFTRQTARQRATRGIIMIVDADWRTKTITGILIFLNGHLVHHASVNQKSTALSTCEAELGAIKEALKSAIYIVQLLSEPDEDPEEPVWLLSDSASRWPRRVTCMACASLQSVARIQTRSMFAEWTAAVCTCSTPTDRRSSARSSSAPSRSLGPPPNFCG